MIAERWLSEPSQPLVIFLTLQEKAPVPNPIDVYSRHAHYLEQYYNGQADKVIPYLNRIAKRLRLELTKTNTVTSQARIEKLLVFTEKMVSAELSGFTDEFSDQIEMFAESEATFTVNLLDEQPDIFNAVLPAPTQLNAAVAARPFNNRLLKDYLGSFSKDQARMVKDAVSMGFFEGKTTGEIVRGIIGTKSQNYKNGILNVSRTSAERMVRTALSHTSAVARNKTFKDNSDLIPYYEWVSTLDGRTSSICRSRDGKVWKVDKGPLPPAHLNCRSTTSPLFKSDVKVDGKKLIKLDQGGTRASIDGQVSADLNYNDWLKKQSKSFQVDVLGKDKAELFRKGGITMDKFVNDKGMMLTLDELKVKYPTSWSKAEL